MGVCLILYILSCFRVWLLRDQNWVCEEVLFLSFGWLFCAEEEVAFGVFEGAVEV